MATTTYESYGGDFEGGKTSEIIETSEINEFKELFDLIRDEINDIISDEEKLSNYFVENGKNIVIKDADQLKHFHEIVNDKSNVNFKNVILSRTLIKIDIADYKNFYEENEKEIDELSSLGFKIEFIESKFENFPKFGDDNLNITIKKAEGDLEKLKGILNELKLGKYEVNSFSDFEMVIKFLCKNRNSFNKITFPKIKYVLKNTTEINNIKNFRIKDYPGFENIINDYGYSPFILGLTNIQIEIADHVFFSSDENKKALDKYFGYHISEKESAEELSNEITINIDDGITDEKKKALLQQITNLRTLGINEYKILNINGIKFFIYNDEKNENRKVVKFFGEKFYTKGGGLGGGHLVVTGQKDNIETLFRYYGIEYDDKVHGNYETTPPNRAFGQYGINLFKDFDDRWRVKVKSGLYKLVNGGSDVITIFDELLSELKNGKYRRFLHSEELKKLKAA